MRTFLLPDFHPFCELVRVRACLELSELHSLSAKHSVKAGSHDSLGHGVAQDCSLESWPRQAPWLPHVKYGAPQLSPLA